MHTVIVSLCAVGLATFTHAYTTPGANTWGPLLTPDLTQSVTQGKEFTVTWDPEGHATEGVTVSLVLCHGSSSNCVPEDTAIASGIPADRKAYDWSVPCDLTPGTQGTDTGYGMLIIVDGTGEFQYSTQFSCLENEGCSSSTASSNATSSATASGSMTILPNSQQTASTSATTNGTAPLTTASGSWGSVTQTLTSGSATYTVVAGSTWSSSSPGSTLTTTVAAGTTVAASGSTGTASSAAATPSTFTGNAGQLGRNIGGMVVAAALALFTL